MTPPTIDDDYLALCKRADSALMQELRGQEGAYVLLIYREGKGYGLHVGSNMTPDDVHGFLQWVGTVIPDRVPDVMERVEVKLDA